MTSQSMSGKFEKAKIHVLDTKEVIEAMFNPTQYSYAINIKFKGESVVSGGEKSKGRQRSPDGPLEIDKADFGDFTVELFFDSYEDRKDVREDHSSKLLDKTVAGTNKLMELAFLSKEGKKRNTAPVCLFEWGKFYYKGIISNVEQTFTMFLSDGTPVRANVRITMRPAADAQEMLKLKGVSDSRRSRTIKAGDRLDIIASEELKSPFLWRKIADANNIDNPIGFPSAEDIGKTLIIPE